MNKLLLLLSLTLAFIGSTYAGEKEVTLARECIAKIKEIDPSRNILPYKFSKFSYYSLDTIIGRAFSDEPLDQDNDYCDWFDEWGGGDAIYGSSTGCAVGIKQSLEIIVKGYNRFDEVQSGVFVCAFRGCNYELDGIRVERSGRKYSDKKMPTNSNDFIPLDLSHLSGGNSACQDQGIYF
jgi:hypothetical protein